MIFFLALTGCQGASDTSGMATEASESSTGMGDSTGQPTGGVSSGSESTGGATTDATSSGSTAASSSGSTDVSSSNSAGSSSSEESTGGSEVECEWQDVLASTRIDAATAIASGSTQVVFAGNAGDLEDFGDTSRGFLAAYTFDGERQWGRQLSNQSVDVSSVAIDSQGEVVVTGSTNSPATLWVRKFDADGDDLWQRDYVMSSGSASPAQITIDTDDSIVVAGSVFSGALLGPGEPFGSNVANPILLRLNPQGEPVLELQVVTEWYEGYRDAVINPNGEVLVAGYTLEGTGFPFGDGLVSRYDSSGTLLERTVFELEPFEEEEIEAIALGPGGDIFIAGSTTSALDGTESAGGSDAFVARMDNSGAVVWGRLFGGTDDDIFETLHLDASGDLVLGGATGEDGVLVRYGPDGDELESRTIENRVHDAASSPAGDLFVAGRLIDPASPDPTFGGIDAVLGRVCPRRD